MKDLTPILHSKKGIGDAHSSHSSLPIYGLQNPGGTQELMQSAWQDGNGKKVMSTIDLPQFEESEIQKLCYNPTFLPALSIADFVQRGY